MNKIKKIDKNYIAIISSIIILLFWIVYIWYPMYVDMYNFRQLEKAKPILESIPENAWKFYTLEEFNEKYNANINPIKNCYYVSNNNGDEKYIFGFKLESWYYKNKYWEEYYSYPFYNISPSRICVGWLQINNNSWWSCVDWGKTRFENTIINPCE